MLIEALETLVRNLFRALVRGREVPEEPLRLMVMTPPGTAKSTYLSKLFPPWVFAQFPILQEAMQKVKERAEPLGVLACSHSADIARDFGHVARNYAMAKEKYLGYQINRDSRAADKWALSNGCYYQSAGVDTGISGRRMHIGFIDDFCGQEQDANSQLFNDAVWVWYENDFVNRLQPIAARIIIANHRNEDDLCGRLLAKEKHKWRVIRFRLLIENEQQAAEDPLGRSVGEWIWPEYFTKEQVEERMSNPRASGIQQQEPSPQEGGFFRKDWLLGYDPSEIADLSEFRFYAASDHAVSEKQAADLTCLLVGAYGRGKLYIMPDFAWERMGSKAAVDAMFKLVKKYRPINWWAEKGHISKSIGPFLQDRMIEEGVFASIQEVTPAADKMTRAQSIHGMMSMGLVRFPRFAPRWSAVERELLLFPNGKHDDFVDALAHLGRGIHEMSPGSKAVVLPTPKINDTAFTPSIKWLKETTKRHERNLRILQRDR